jgi:hypothetical protein
MTCLPVITAQCRAVLPLLSMSLTRARLESSWPQISSLSSFTDTMRGDMPLCTRARLERLIPRKKLQWTDK